MAKLSGERIRRASSERYLAGWEEIPGATELGWSYRKAYQRVLDAGWDFKPRKGVALGAKHAKKFTMTMRKTIWLASDWEDKHIGHKAAILWHELVHIAQRRELGDAKFLAMYATAGGRWELEVPAYRMSLRVYEKLTEGQGSFDGAAWIEKKLPSFRESYWLGGAAGLGINPEQYERETRKIWSRELPP
jgi:hypothetical protein